MPTIAFCSHEGDVTTVAVEPGTSVMQAAIDHAVPGIIGECGGQAMCATCHVYVDSTELTNGAVITEDEDAMLDVTADPRDPARSRLGCQLSAGVHFEDLRVDLPASQV